MQKIILVTLKSTLLMKKIITLLILMCSLGVMAQEYTPLVREGVKWECVSEQIGWGDEKKVSYKIYFDGDSVKDDIRYKKCYIETESSKKIVALMREDINNKKVYIRYGSFPTEIRYNTPIIDGLDGVDADAEYLLYDFSEIGNSDVIKMASNTSGGYLAGAQIVKSTMLVGDKICNRSQVLDSDKKPLYSIVEGLGFIPEFSTTVSIGVAQNLYEGTMLDFLFYDSDTDGWTNFSYFNRLVADDGTVLYESPNTYTPLVREGVKWNCVLCYRNVWLPEENYDCKYHIEFKGDTIIDDKTYQKCYYIFEDSANYPNDIPRAFVREDVAAKKVYAMFNPEYKHDKVYQMIDIYNYYNELYSEVLLYDFSNILNPEQYWFNSISSESYSVKTIQVAENNCKMFTLKSQFDIPELDIDLLESVGFCKGNDNAHDKRGCGDLLAPFPSIWLGGYNSYPVFLNFEDAEGNIVYVAQEYNGIESVASTDKDAAEATRYDLYGRRLSQPAQGVNIVKMSDGTTRKEMVK